MAYSLAIHEGQVLRYLRNYQGLSREGRVKLFANIHADLRDRADFYLNDPNRRLAPGSPYFWYDIVLWDRHGDGRIRRFWFVVSDAAAPFGVLSLEYVEEGGPQKDLTP